MRIAIVGLGYVGLPLAVAFSKKYGEIVGFDINKKKIEELISGTDRTGEVEPQDLAEAQIKYTSEINDLRECTAFIVAVPTPIDSWHRPDLTPVIKASETVGQALKKGDIVIYESTVYPGVTEDTCGPILASVSGLTQGVDFKLGYSPERINPGDKKHTVTLITKVVSGEDQATLDTIANLYEKVITAGVHRAPSIRAAEAAKVIENTQRDINIALMNELAIIFDRMGLRTADVLAAARTKWNFLPFEPGLVGGHCIGVDPYYLTTKAEELGYHPQVILAGRRINDGMGTFIAQKTVKLLIHSGVTVKGAKIGILGLTFKEDVPDLRNSRVPDIVAELRQFGVDPIIHDPTADHEEAHEEYGLSLSDFSAMKNLDAVILAVAHKDYKTMGAAKLQGLLRPAGVFVDVKSCFDPSQFSAACNYWSL